MRAGIPRSSCQLFGACIPSGVRVAASPRPGGRAALAANLSSVTAYSLT